MMVDGSNFGVDLGDHRHELFVADGTVSVLVSEVDHLVHLCAGEVLSHAGSDLLELLGAEEAAVGGVEGLEDGLKGGFAVAVAAEPKDLKEGWEVDVTLMAGVVDDGEDLSCLCLQVEGADGVDQLFGGDTAAAIVVECIEDLLQLADSVGVKALLDVLVGVETLGRSRCRRSRLGHKIFLI